MNFYNSAAMRLLIEISLLVIGCNANFQPGLRAVIFYSHDKSFVGSNVYVQELNGSAYDKLFCAKEFVTKPKTIESAYEFMSLIDGRCDFQIKCEKICDETTTTIRTTRNTPTTSKTTKTTPSTTRTTTATPIATTTTSKTTPITTTTSKPTTTTPTTTRITETTPTTTTTTKTTPTTRTKIITTKTPFIGSTYLPPATYETRTWVNWTRTYQPYTGTHIHFQTMIPYTGTPPTWRTRRPTKTKRWTTRSVKYPYENGTNVLNYYK